MSLPFQPPLEPMLAKLRPDIPREEGWLFEPKWDGFRAIVFKDGDEVTIFSRDKKPLNRYFPELIAPLREVLPEVAIVDGEIVVPDEHGLEFDLLLLRIHPAESRVNKLAAETPSSFVAFDLLALGSDDLREVPFAERRARLEAELTGAVPLPSQGPDEDTGEIEKEVARALRPGPTVALTPQTDDPDVAAFWFEVFEGAGLDGIIAKKADGPYVPGKRLLAKIKHQRTADCVIGGYRLNKTKDGIGSLLLGLYDDESSLHYVGHTSSFKAAERRALLEQLREFEGGDSFGRGRTPGGPSRWVGMSGRDNSWIGVEPVLVCEVSYDHLQSGRFRHAATFKRWRPEKPPQDCTFEQIEARGRQP